MKLVACSLLEVFCRGIYDRSKQAFVSFVQAYAKHECSLLLRVKELDLCQVAEGAFALVHLPKMPELRNRDLSGFNQQSTPVDSEAIPYKCVSLVIRLLKFILFIDSLEIRVWRKSDRWKKTIQL